MLEVVDLESGYGETQVLWRVSMRVPEKSLTCVIGPNGAGKTTLLNTLMGFIKPWNGRILFRERDITRLKPNKKIELGLNIVPEGRRLFPNMSVRENLLMGAYTKSAREKLEDSLELVYSLFPILRERQNQKAGTLSGGEQQMLAIARTLMTRPRLILLDEPSQGIAPKVVDDIVRVLLRLRDEEKITLLLVEQNIRVVLENGDYIYVMDQGRIVSEGERSDILAKIPDHIRSFIGI